MPRIPHEGAPPPLWPEDVAYLLRPRLEKTFPPELVPVLLSSPPSSSKATSPPATKFAPQPSPHPAAVMIKRVSDPKHPANGQRCLVAKKAIKGGEMIIPYLGEIHATFTKADDTEGTGESGTVSEGSSASTAVAKKKVPPPQPSHEESDYDISLLRLSASDVRNPYPGYHISIGVDAAHIGNAARFVNDYRGVGSAPNAEFRVGRGPGGEMRMEVWSLRGGVQKGDELLVSYGKGWWGARTG